MVREVGAAAGVAGLVGLGVLWTLYLAQARDVKRLREWAGGAPERSGAGVATPPRRPAAWHRRVGARPVVVALVGLLVLVGGAAALVGGDGGDRTGPAQAKDDNKPRRSRLAVQPGAVTVAVLNGTTVPGLAAALRDRLVAAGFRKGIINDFPDPRRAASVVQYAPGHQVAAQAVGRRLRIGTREPVTAEGRALAGDATVVVIAGADQAP
jgi:LytR cell envelope-related transcriptional attenuator